LAAESAEQGRRWLTQSFLQQTNQQFSTGRKATAINREREKIPAFFSFLVIITELPGTNSTALERPPSLCFAAACRPGGEGRR
jgi:hypothetical protein